jgi:hypothetical protein
MTDDIGDDDMVVEAVGEQADPNALSSILDEAVADVDAAGGREAHLLRGVIGKTAFDQLPTRKSTSQAWAAWRDASPQSKPKAVRMLAIALAQAAGKPHLVDRIVREINDMDPFARDTAPPLKASARQEQKTYPRAAAKIAPKDRYIDMLRLATKADASAYIKARSADHG